jgi:hypothetical protein
VCDSLCSWRTVQDHGKVFTVAENKQPSTQKSSVEQIWDLAACSRVVDEMKIKSEKQSSNVHEPAAEGSSSRLPFDPEKYRKYQDFKPSQRP